MRDVTTETHASDNGKGSAPPKTPPPGPVPPRKPDAGRPDGWEPPMMVEPEGRNWTAWAGILTGIVVLAVAGVLMATRLPGGTTLAGTPVASVDDAAPALQAAAASLGDQEFRFTTEAGTELVMTGAQLGLAIDVSESIQPITQGLPSLSAWATRLPAGPTQAPLVTGDIPTGTAEEVAESITLAPQNAVLDVRRSGIDTTPGEDGLDVSPEAVQVGLAQAVATIATQDPAEWPPVVDATVVGQVTSPPVGQADIDGITDAVNLLQDAEVVVTGDVILPVDPDADTESNTDTTDRDDEDGDQPRRQPQSITLSRAELRTLVDVEAVPDAPEGQRLRLVPDPGATPARLVALMDLALIEPELSAHVEDRSPTPSRGEDPADASDVTGEIVVDDVQPGFVPNREATLAMVIEAALDGGGEVDIVGSEDTVIDPADLGIVEPVSTFTTYYTAGQSRVTNIRRMAELVDGVIVPAGQSFEVNHFVGRRTAANGFVGGGAIQNGELVTEFGGGVSQFATTFFNAAWFAGVELVDFKAHSVYFSRYPPGREATLNFPTVNLEIRNNTPHAILIDTDSNETSVTVTFWSTPYWDVQTIMGPCQCGGSFRVTNERILTAPGGQPVTEEYTTIYTVLRPS